MVRSSAKGMALGTKLRGVREESGLSQRALARKLGVDSGTMSRAESGERPPDAELTAAILGALGVTGARRDEIMALARDDVAAGSAWLAIGLPEQRVQLDALLQMEQLSTEIVDVSPLVVPGLLQVSGYTRAIMRAAEVPNTEIETRVAIRMGRRDVLTRANPTRLTALIGAQVFRQRIGGPEVMRDQLEHLLKMAEQDNVELRAFPVDDMWHDAFAGAFSMLKIDRAKSVVHLENTASGLFLQEPEDVKVFESAVNRVLAVSMSEDQTRELIAREARRVTGD
ncbi:helix-turn-helix domain-containing protein [Saccharothrix coeruleofusca]|nr:helix-turn-helix transcriptional regulator [Saccharothrix coeruleofusca]